MKNTPLVPASPVSLPTRRPSGVLLFVCLMALAGCADPAPECGNGEVEASESCDDGNTVTENCAFGESGCTVCSASCEPVAGAPSTCGDGAVDLDNGEACDDGNTLTEGCAYGEVGCEVCGATCQLAAGATALCGDGVVNAGGGEVCDDGNTLTESCAYGETSCTVCDLSCQSVAGATSFCGDDQIDTAGGEDCDDGNAVTEPCDYGTTSCSVCNATCHEGSGAATFCGDGARQLAEGEFCDDGNTTTETNCPYGVALCNVCDALCDARGTYGAYCGDGQVNGAESCDDGNTLSGDGCESNCTLICGAGSGAQRAHLTSYGCFLTFPRTNHAGAVQRCDAVTGFTLLETRTAAKNAFVAANILRRHEAAWLALTDTATEGTFVWGSGAPLTFAGWVGDEPNDSGGEDCAELQWSGAWNDLPCGNSHTVVCEQVTCGDGTVQANETCDDGNLVNGDGCDERCQTTACGNGIVTAGEACDDGNLVDGDGCESDCSLVCGAAPDVSRAWLRSGSCYVELTGGYAFEAAALTCQNRGAALLTISSRSENDFIAGVIRDYTLLGLNDRAIEGTFVWESGEATTFTFWNGGEPNNSGDEDCVGILAGSEGRWNDHGCSGSVSSVFCETALSVCGDGTTDALYEQCDDGDQVTQTCIYGAMSCQVCDERCELREGKASFCGDRKVDWDAGETCDDGDLDDTDGCAACQVGTGMTCVDVGDAVVCAPVFSDDSWNVLVDDAYDGTLASMTCVTVPVASGGDDRVDELFVDVFLDHERVGELVLKLASPGGRVVTLMNRPLWEEPADDGRGSGGSPVYVENRLLFSDGAAHSAEDFSTDASWESCRYDEASEGYFCALRPAAGSAEAGMLAAFVGDNAVGDWRLCAGDAVSGTVGGFGDVRLGVRR